MYGLFLVNQISIWASICTFNDSDVCKYFTRHSCLSSTIKVEKKGERTDLMGTRAIAVHGKPGFIIISLSIEIETNSDLYLYCIYRLHVWGPRPPGHTHPSCSRPACGQDQAQRDTSAGTTCPGPMHGRAPWTGRPVGRWVTVGRGVWEGFAAERGSLQLGCSSSSASQRLLGLKLRPAPPREKKMESRVWKTGDGRTGLMRSETEGIT